MPLYAVELTYHAVVHADSEIEAMQFAEEHARDIVFDGEPDCGWSNIVRSADGLPQGWDDQCVPYGGDGETSIRDLFEQDPPQPERDTRTIDMFAEAQS